MAEITAKAVNELREKTGQPMMKCKQVLVEAGGDVAKAIEIFRKQGVKASLTERAATEGRVFGHGHPNAAAIVEINCNTDFTAKSEAISALGNKLAHDLAHNPSMDVQSAGNDGLTEASQKTGENVRLGKTAVMSAPEGGKVGLYLYGISGKIGVLMSFKGNPSEDFIKQLGGHIAFARPLGLTRDTVPADIVAKERDMAVEQAKATGKPQQIAEKIAEGKLNSFFAEKVLLDQEFFNAGVFKGTITNYLKQNNVTLEKYVRIETGQ
ncbi:MAG TPA: translation elongation factor Ts [Tepidisphaeraceae bacterium]|jgi:elongation factor Ts|nr:translation elongation factor Ts [Tepidisphaeraceae bacterium]